MSPTQNGTPQPERDAAPMEDPALPIVAQLARQGTWLFRWRSYVPLPLFAFLVAWIYLHPSPDQGSFSHWAWQIFCLGIGLAGLAVRVWVGGFVPANTSGRNIRKQKAAALNTSGPYSLFRHPLYVGNFLMWLAAGAFCRSVPLVVLTCVYFGGCYLRIMVVEERFLLTQFGDAFRDWAAVTPAVIPAWSRWKAPDLPFSWRAAARREYSGLFGLVVALFLLDLAEGAGLSGMPSIDPFWAPLLVVVAVLYMVLRTLKRRTTLLRVSGR